MALKTMFYALFWILTKIIRIFARSPAKKYVRVRVYDIARGDNDCNEAPYETIMVIEATNPVTRCMPYPPKVLKVGISDNDIYNSIVEKITRSLIPMEKVPTNEPIMFVGPIYEIDMSSCFECSPPDYDEDNIVSVAEVIRMAK